MITFNLLIDDKEVQKLLREMPEQLSDAFALGALESAQEVLQTTGLQSYPPATEANAPPTPYYIRGRGMQMGGTLVPAYNDLKSERLGTQFATDRRGEWTVAVGNRASYAPFVIGQKQAGAMAKIGWRKLEDVAQQKRGTIERIVQKWVERAIARMNR